MDRYLEIKLKPNAEMRENVLLNMVYTKLHKALCEINLNTIGVNFPNCKKKLGDIIRIHSDVSSLEKLQNLDWLGTLSESCFVSAINRIPEKVQYRCVSRMQSNMTQSKFNRLIKRGTIKPEQIREYKAKMFAQGLDNPYLEMESSSNGHKHRRYIKFGELKSQIVIGEFDSFGLSKQATIPWF